MDVFAVLAEPNRRLILDRLSEPPSATVGDLVDLLGITQPAVSKHLRVLRNAGLVHAVPDGQRRIYQLDHTPLVEVDLWIDRYRHRWATALDRLEHHLEQSHDPR